MKIRSFLCLAGIVLAVNATAATTTKLYMSKTTTLTAEDATNFSKTFGAQFSSSEPEFKFNCNNSICTITAATSGFSGATASQLLSQRPTAKFTSSNGLFMLNCGKTSVDFCNIVQKNAVLQ